MRRIYFTLLFVLSALLVSLTPCLAEGVPTFSANAHIQDYGWRFTACDSNHHIVIGTMGEAKRIEAFQFAVDNPNVQIQYEAHVQNIGWQGARTGPETAGTEGQKLQIEGVWFNLTGPEADQYDILYRTHVANYGWLDWAKNGQICGTTNHFFRCEAIEVNLVPKGESIPGLSYKTPIIEATSRVEAQHIYLVNQLRKSLGYSYISGNAALKKVADVRLMELPVRLSHIRPNGAIYETAVRDAFPNYPTPGGGFIESFIYGSTNYANPAPAFQCYMAYPHLIDIMLDPDIKYMAWSGRVSGTMGYSIELFSGLSNIDFDKY